MTLIQVVVLAVVQGFAELLPVSSSAHVIVAEKLMGLDPSTPEMTLLLVALHTGTMSAVVYVFFPAWKRVWLGRQARAGGMTRLLALATLGTVFVGGGLVELVERLMGRDRDIEQLFGRLDIIAAALAASGLLILLASRFDRTLHPATTLTPKKALLIGVMQGWCVPFRGFSRSGATISTGILLGVDRLDSEVFSFALAVILTPIAVGREGWRLIHAGPVATSTLGLTVLGGAIASAAGVLALKLLTRFLANGKWWAFGYYCLGFATIAMALFLAGF